MKDYDVRSRLVGRDFKGGERGRDGLLAETPPLEAKRLLISKAATRRRDGRWKKLSFIDVRKAHLNVVCEEDVYIVLPDECGEALWVSKGCQGVGGPLCREVRGDRTLKRRSVWSGLQSS